MATESDAIIKVPEFRNCKNQKQCGRNSRCVKRSRSCPPRYPDGIEKRKGRKEKRCCCKGPPKPKPHCSRLVNTRCRKKGTCGRKGYCSTSKCKKSFLNMILETGANMEMDIDESNKDLDNGNLYGFFIAITIWGAK